MAKLSRRPKMSKQNNLPKCENSQKWKNLSKGPKPANHWKFSKRVKTAKKTKSDKMLKWQKLLKRLQLSKCPKLLNCENGTVKMVKTVKNSKRSKNSLIGNICHFDQKRVGVSNAIKVHKGVHKKYKSCPTMAVLTLSHTTISWHILNKTTNVSRYTSQNFTLDIHEKNPVHTGCVIDPKFINRSSYQNSGLQFW